MLEHSADLYNHISSTQMPIAQNGYLDYNHQHWMDTQRVSHHGNTALYTLHYTIGTRAVPTGVPV